LSGRSSPRRLGGQLSSPKWLEGGKYAEIRNPCKHCHGNSQRSRASLLHDPRHYALGDSNCPWLPVRGLGRISGDLVLQGTGHNRTDHFVSSGGGSTIAGSASRSDSGSAADTSRATSSDDHSSRGGSTIAGSASRSAYNQD